MSIITDIRIQECDELARYEALRRRWPCAPEGVGGARSSGLICATVVARAMWSRLKSQCWPGPESPEDPITAYIWVDFREDRPGFKESLRGIWDKAIESASRQQDGETDDSFVGICRSPAFVRAFWANPLLRLTTSHFKVGPDHRQGKVVLEGEELARQAVVTWDGLRPPTVEAAVNNITRKERDDKGNTTHVFFQNPPLIQIDLTTGEGSAQSLRGMWHFTAKTYLRDGDYRKTGEQRYVLMAVVMHRRTADGIDLVRVFGKTGKEQLPVAQPEPVDWPFPFFDVIPAGTKLTLLYTSLAKEDKAPVIIETLAGHPGMPTALQMQLETRFGELVPSSTVSAENAESPEARADSERQKWDRGRKIDAAALNYKANLLSERRAMKPPVVQEAPGPEGSGSTASGGAQSSKHKTSVQPDANQRKPAGPPAANPRVGGTPPTGPRANRPHTDRALGEPPQDRLPPTEPRADRARKRHMEDDGIPWPRDFKKPRKSRYDTGPLVTGSNTEEVSTVRRRPGQSSSGHRSSDTEPRSSSVAPRDEGQAVPRQERNETGHGRADNGRPSSTDERRGSSSK